MLCLWLCAKHRALGSRVNWSGVLPAMHRRPGLVRVTCNLTLQFLAKSNRSGRTARNVSPHTRGLLRRITAYGGLQHCIGKEVSRYEQGKTDFIENIDDGCIHYDGGRVTANESLLAEISARGLRRTTKVTGLDRKTIRAILNGKKVKASTLAKTVMRLQRRWDSST